MIITALVLFMLCISLLSFAGIVLLTNLKQHLIHPWRVCMALTVAGLTIGGFAWSIWRSIYWVG